MFGRSLSRSLVTGSFFHSTRLGLGTGDRTPTEGTNACQQIHIFQTKQALGRESHWVSPAPALAKHRFSMADSGIEPGMRMLGTAQTQTVTKSIEGESRFFGRRRPHRLTLCAALQKEGGTWDVSRSQTLDRTATYLTPKCVVQSDSQALKTLRHSVQWSSHARSRPCFHKQIETSPVSETKPCKTIETPCPGTIFPVFVTSTESEHSHQIAVCALVAQGNYCS